MLFIAVHPTSADQTWSLADDFSYTENSDNSTWSYRLDDFADEHPTFPLLTSNDRNANALWGSMFATAPNMWSDTTGYWGIGKNTTGKDQLSPRNGTRWTPGEVLLHPKGGTSSAGLVVTWRAAGPMMIDVKYTVGSTAAPTDGVGLRITKRIGGVDTEIVATADVGGRIDNEVVGIAVAEGDQLFFRFNDRGNPGGDITRASIIVKGKPLAAAQQAAIQPGGGTVVEGSRITFSASAADGKTFQWYKDGNPIAGATGASCQIDDVKPADAGTYSVVVDLVSSENAVLRIAPREPLHTDIDVPREPYWSPTPRQVFSQTLAEQEKELKTNVLMLRFAESRRSWRRTRIGPRTISSVRKA